MSTSKVLYERGRRINSDSENEEEIEEDVWDDRKLNDAYDKALRIANAEVAKRVAMSTNSTNTQTDSREEHLKKKKEKQESQSTSSKINKKDSKWKPGMACRAVYDEDGQEYEAFVLQILNENECIVRFLGYENCEIVPVNTLKPSLGNKARQEQIEQAASEKEEDGEYNANWKEREADRTASPSTEASFQKRKRSQKKKKNNQKQPNFELPDMPFQMPNLSMMPNLGSLDLPMPPPPPAALSARADCEEQAVSSMLLSWYMSGYYTGLYQGMKRAREGRKQ